MHPCNNCAHHSGIAVSVVNVMELCRIHHAVFDVGILGSRLDILVQIRSERLREVGGPMLRNVIQEVHGSESQYRARKLIGQELTCSNVRSSRSGSRAEAVRACLSRSLLLGYPTQTRR